MVSNSYEPQFWQASQAEIESLISQNITFFRVKIGLKLLSRNIINPN